MMCILPGDSIATLDGQPLVPKKKPKEYKVAIGAGDSNFVYQNIMALKEAWQ
jgi:hypothetical protein